MGKAGNKARKEAKKSAPKKVTMAEAIARQLQEDDQAEKKKAAEEAERMEVALLGPRSYPPEATPVLDMLGRKRNEAPKPTLTMYPGASKPPENPQEHKTTEIQLPSGNVIILPPPVKKKETTTVQASLDLQPKRRVTIMRDHTYEYPQLCMYVYVSPDPWVHDDEARFAQLFARACCHKASTVEDADIVVFGGGTDVDPQFYGETPHIKTFSDPYRDEEDMKLYEKCMSAGIPMFGVCRGAQFLHVMNGGKLFQHVDGHHGDHKMWDRRTKRVLPKISSVHHQMVRKNEEGGMQVLGVCHSSKERHLNAETYEEGVNADIEAFFYPDTLCLGVQGHPEYQNYPEYSQWCLAQIEDLINNNPDVDIVKGRRRLKKDLLEQRQLGWDKSIILPTVQEN